MSINWNLPVQTKGHTPPKSGVNFGICGATGKHRVGVVGDSKQSIASVKDGKPVMTTFLYREDGTCHSHGEVSPFDLENV